MASTIRSILVGGRSSAAGLAVGDLVLRLTAGLSLAFGHGLGKLPPSQGFIDLVGGIGFPAPTVFAWLAGVGEFAGGLLLALGLLTRLGGLLIAATLAVAIYHHTTAGDPYATMEMAALYLAIGACYLFAGADRFSVDKIILRRRPPGSPQA